MPQLNGKAAALRLIHCIRARALLIGPQGLRYLEAAQFWMQGHQPPMESP
jgi:hypothetical protein